MKGAALAGRYPEPGLRPMDDVDILVPRPQHDSALRRLEAAGWRRVDIPGRHHETVLTHAEVPGLPLETIVDPTGAGDAFAGGFLGFVAASGDTSAEGFRRATIYGSAMGSFCCEDFSVDRLIALDPETIERRFEEFGRLTRFEPRPVADHA